MSKKKDLILLGLLLVLLVILNYHFLDSALAKTLNISPIVKIQRVIDGDTVVTSSGDHIRLLGINAPETTSKEPFSEAAKNFLIDLIQNKSVRLEFTSDRVDKYGRTLAYIFLNNENVNVEMVKNGYANYYFYSGRDKYSNTLEDAWSSCLESKENLCQPSKETCSSCIKLENAYILNSCSFSCDINGWYVKGEGREKVVFNDSLGAGQEEHFEIDLANSGGSLYLRDEVGDLVEFTQYQ